jgi:hypothetical protein
LQGWIGLVIHLLQLPLMGIRNHLFPNPLGLAYDHRIAVLQRLLRKQGRMNAAENHGTSPLAILPSKVISPCGIGCHTADADQITLLLQIHGLQLLFEDAYFVLGWSKTGNQMKSKLGDHEALRFFETGILARRDQ